MFSRRSSNGRFIAGDNLADELAQLDREIAAVERAGPPLADRIAEAEAELGRCEEHFRTHGFASMSPVPAERARYHQIAVQGALMVLGRDALLRAERNRMTKQFEASGSVGISAAEKTARSAELWQRRRLLAAQLELQWRKAEAGGELAIDNRRDGEMFLQSSETLEAIAAGQEATG